MGVAAQRVKHLMMPVCCLLAAQSAGVSLRGPGLRILLLRLKCIYLLLNLLL